MFLITPVPPQTPFFYSFKKMSQHDEAGMLVVNRAKVIGDMCSITRGQEDRIFKAFELVTEENS